ncbi:response regulator [Paenibacillaceae bacterium WGS1546]|uniref:response regulator n=1 Tax=Cohnella sp. WGS1546 TaxID=3366810 RepID=UPI00372D46D6
MPKILIVDDEAIYRKGLRAMIASEDPQWEVVGDAKDGCEAMELIDVLKPDVVLTDIRMPRMDGLQLQKFASERVPDLRCVVISGYEDFAYVRQSLRHGAKDYLTKPVEREELSKVLKKLKAEIREAGRRASGSDAPANETVRRRQAGDRLAAALLRGSLDEEDLEAVRRVGIALEGPCYACMVVKLDKESVDRERYRRTDPSLFQLYIRQFAQEIVGNRLGGFCFAFSDSEVVALANLPDRAASREKLVDAADSIRRQIQSLSNLTVTIGIGSAMEGAASIPKSYREAEIALLYRLVVGGDKVLGYDEMAAESQERAGAGKWSWDSLEEAVNEGRIAEIDERVDAAIGELCRWAQTPDHVHQQVCKLILHYYELTEELGTTKRWLGERDIRAQLVEICSSSSGEELADICKRLFGRLAAQIASGNRSTDRDPASLALRYIERHYREPISLKDVAERVHLHPAYLSAVLKNKTGKSFVEHLIGLRLEDAKKRLALTDDKIATIAERTGFANIRHFNRVFRADAGLTPKDYRSGIRGNGD